MKRETLNEQRMREMERDLGCVFCPDGECAEMSIELRTYTERTQEIDGVTFGWYTGDTKRLREAIGTVDREWPRYFQADSPIFCAYIDGEPISFCLVDTTADDSILARPDLRVGSIGCVGTLLPYRGRGIALRMVDLATLILRDAGCDKSYISYTHIDHWYAKLGYEVFARFTFRQ